MTAAIATPQPEVKCNTSAATSSPSNPLLNPSTASPLNSFHRLPSAP
jgi:hypothetical protein